jgi:hypothetical protein
MAKVDVKPGEAQAILDAFGVEALCDRLVAGETQTKICKELKVTKGSLGRWISLDAERQARVREARIEAAEAYEEMADEGLRMAKNTFQLAKARERAQHLRWKASKADPRRYGDKLQVDQTTTVVNLSDDEIARRRSEIQARLAEARGQRPAS